MNDHFYYFHSICEHFLHNIFIYIIVIGKTGSFVLFFIFIKCFYGLVGNRYSEIECDMRANTDNFHTISNRSAYLNCSISFRQFFCCYKNKYSF